MNKTIIIAEAGVNHNGSIDTAFDLIDVASAAGADIVKFQTFKAKTLVTPSASKADYQKQFTGAQESQFEMIKKLEISKEMHTQLISRCSNRGIRFASTGFDVESIDQLVDLGAEFLKIPSGDITNLPYLRHVGSKGLPIILSSGMANMKEIKNAFNVLLESGVKKTNITILHCNTEYPTPMEDVNLRAMLSIRNELDVNIGYSDHTLGIEVPIAAVAMGASVIEKHFTLDRSMDGPDHAASLHADQLKQMVEAIRNIEKAMGSTEKKPSPSEQKNMTVARKSIVALDSIKRGEILSELNITTKRPGNGISPMEWDKVIGAKANKDYKRDELIKF